MIERQWRKSSHSGQNNDCVELAVTQDATHIRDSKNVGSGMIRLGSAQWSAFLGAVKAGRI